MENITLETRRESYDAILESLSTRQATVFQELQQCPRLTANELAARLWRQGAIPTPDRNFVHTRLTEMMLVTDVSMIQAMKHFYQTRLKSHL